MDVFSNAIAPGIGRVHSSSARVSYSFLLLVTSKPEKLPLRASNIRQTIFCGQSGRSAVVLVVVVVDTTRTRRSETIVGSAGKLQSPDALSSTPSSGGGGMGKAARLSPFASRSFRNPRSR